MERDFTQANQSEVVFTLRSTMDRSYTRDNQSEVAVALIGRFLTGADVSKRHNQIKSNPVPFQVLEPFFNKFVAIQLMYMLF
jgi:hypothetical protein